MSQLAAADPNDNLNARLKQARQEMGTAKAETAHLRKQWITERANWDFKMQQEHSQTMDYEKKIRLLTLDVAVLKERNTTLSIDIIRVKDACVLNEKKLTKQFLEDVKSLRDELKLQDEEIALLKQQLSVRCM